MNDRQQQQCESRDTLEQLSAKLATLQRDHDAIRATLCGDLTGRQGAMQYLVKLMEDIYGAKDDKKSGMLSRLSDVETQQRKVLWVCLGASAVIGLLWKVLTK